MNNAFSETDNQGQMDNLIEADSKPLTEGADMPPVVYQNWFPVFSAGSLILLLIFNLLLLVDNPFRHTLFHWLTTNQQLWMLVPPWLVIVIFELTLSRNLGRKGNRIIALLEQQKQSLLRQKGQLQTHLNQSWSQTDKLKRYITDKLVEVLEFDEKFYHFKGIASEIRHNGVICYDRIRSALHQAIEQEKFLSLYESGDPDRSSGSDSEELQGDALVNARADSVNPNNVDFYQASNDLEYLWDLLDLSTADNLAEHITSYLIEQETLAYQQSLHQLHEAGEKAPVYQRFSINEAILSALCRCTDDPALNELLRLSLINPALLKPAQSIESAATLANLGQDTLILGKNNHLILALENLVKNAQFFSQKVPFKQSEDRIYLNCETKSNQVTLKLTNRGPQIPVEEQQKIFQIGFSTRRSQGSHGKGLGLYFVEQIVKGYSGQIQVNTRENQGGHYQLEYHQQDSVERYDIQVTFDPQGRPWVQELPASASSSRQKDFPVNLIQLPDLVIVRNLQTGLSQEIDQTAIRTHAEKEEKNKDPLLIDTSYQDLPGWSLHLKSSGKNWKFVFKPLDRRGVCFSLKLPTLDARMSGEDLETLLGSDSPMARPGIHT